MFELVELTTMTVSPKRTMLPPIWVAACDSQRRRNPPLRKTASGPGSDASRAAVAATVTRPGRRSRGVTAAVIAGSPRATNSTSRRSSVAPFEQDVPAAVLAAQPDVGAEAIDQPGVAAARVGAAEADDIAEEQREDGLVWHRRVRVSKARVARGPGRGSGSWPAARAGRPG